MVAEFVDREIRACCYYAENVTQATGLHVLTQLITTWSLGSTRSLSVIPRFSTSGRSVYLLARTIGLFACLGATAVCHLLHQYWLVVSTRNAAIDLAAWDPARGVRANQNTFNQVYVNYFRPANQKPEFWWAGLAGIAGGSFASSFFDLRDGMSVPCSTCRASINSAMRWQIYCVVPRRNWCARCLRRSGCWPPRARGSRGGRRLVPDPADDHAEAHLHRSGPDARSLCRAGMPGSTRCTSPV
jgi:hypothetical protein